MYKFVLPITAVFLLAACDSSDGVRVSRSVEINTDGKGDAGKGLKVISSLQCPADQGVLTRIGSASVDGRTCTYSGPRGAEVQLHLVELNGQNVDDVLKRFQNTLIPADEARNGPIAVTATETQNTTVEGENIKSAEVRMPGLSVSSKGDRANVSLPGMRIEADGNKANIRIGGLVINADDKGSTVTGDGLDVQADDNGATVKAVTRNAIRATMIHAMSKPDANGWRVVGYDARGPGGGPIALATFRTRDRDEGAIVDSVRELVTLNVGD